MSIRPCLHYLQESLEEGIKACIKHTASGLGGDQGGRGGAYNTGEVPTDVRLAFLIE